MASNNDSNITARIKSLLSSQKRKNVELAEYLGMSPQSLQNKFNRGSFSADDLIKIGVFIGAELSYLKDNEKLIVLDSSCIREHVEK